MGNQKSIAELDLERLLTEVDLAQMLKRAVKTIRKDRLLGRGPRFIRVGRLVRYRPRDIVDYLNACAGGGQPLKAQRN
jgi:hypothetical protein